VPLTEDDLEEKFRAFEKVHDKIRRYERIRKTVDVLLVTSIILFAVIIFWDVLNGKPLSVGRNQKIALSFPILMMLVALLLEIHKRSYLRKMK